MVSTIFPVDLKKANRLITSNKEINAEQINLERDINFFNNQLINDNTLGLYKLNIANLGLISSIKYSNNRKIRKRVTKFNYRELSDGIHYNTKLK